ncbi:hypothetical protein J7E88_02365 [Streptomyces sp. ISL-10]|uniref:hypothetical protein n=1 Tax=Streptomyces sp. ISL-10 TaxID=2819172 RepID=UPI001BE63910|nr:hypothetical protein [Streptomyces sp. ISL-10]MBT2364204.1 hypothetical protein [Streptomyces sp. ISL-10]
MTEKRSGDAIGSGAEPRQPTTPALEAVLAAAARPAPVGPEAAERALAAFRAARADGALGLATRPEDDWRPVTRPKARARGIKAGIGAAVAGVMLGGVAMAAGAAPFTDRPPRPPGPGASSGTGEDNPDAVRDSATPTEGTTGAPAGERPPAAKDEAAHCRAYDDAKRRDAARAGAMRKRLEEALGGPQAVADYCARLPAESGAEGEAVGGAPKPFDPSAANAPATPPGKARDQHPRQLPKD